MSRLKKFLVISFALLSFCSSVSAQQQVRVYVNGMRINEEAILYNSLTYVPLRAVSESLGANVSWDADTHSANVTFSEDDAIAKVVSDVSSSVVTIIGNYDNSSAPVLYNKPTMHGTGVIYKSNGHIVTNAHVIKDIKNLTVVLNSGELLPGKVLYSDEKADLAVIKVEKIGLKPITMANSESITSGKTAIAIGTPISLTMRNSVTKGIVSGTDVPLKDSHYKLIQTDASINPGNSGGPLLNIKGELIGINTSKFAAVGIENMGFAIPVDTLRFVISQFETYGLVLRPKLNFTVEQSWEADIGLPTIKGITVKTSSNEHLNPGDIITSVNGISIHSIADLNEAIKNTYKPGNMTVVFERDGESYKAELKL